MGIELRCKECGNPIIYQPEQYLYNPTHIHLCTPCLDKKLKKYDKNMNQGKVRSPCIFCGKPTRDLESYKCDACWEVTRWLDIFLKHKKGREYVKEKLDGMSDD